MRGLQMHLKRIKWRVILLGITAVYLTVNVTVVHCELVNPRQTNVIKPRHYPFCVDKELLEEYKPDLAMAPAFAEYVATNDNTKTKLRTKLILPCFGCGKGLIERWFLNRIYVSPNEIRNSGDGISWDLRDSWYQNLRQWFHIYIKTTVPVEGLLVQSIAGYQGLPHGVFDIQFGCQDCGDGINLDDAETGEALSVGGNAAVLPCKRRSHLHSRHPNVYIYASNVARDSFHINFNFVDIPCRDMKMFQFMILVVKKFGTGSDSVSIFRKNLPAPRYAMPNALYVYTPVIDHNFVDSVDGMPYPFHVTFRRRFMCHSYDENLPWHAAALNFRLAVYGNKDIITMQPDFDLCLQGARNENLVEASIRVSDWVCANPVQTRCDAGAKINHVRAFDCVTDPNRACVCSECGADTVESNSYTQGSLPRLIGRGYMARRFHGIAMIVGSVTATSVSIYVARYFKEAGGGCILVGWWLWVHLGLSYVSFGALFLGTVMGINFPPRPPNEPDTLLESRRFYLNLAHKGIGSIAVLCFCISFFIGPFRPKRLRRILILVHVLGGYILLLLGVVATVVSVACREVKIYVIFLAIFSFVPWGVGCFFQKKRDQKAKLNPRRSYFPIIEAIRVDKKAIGKIPLLALIGLLFVLCVGMMILSSIAGGYSGLGMFGPCSNCIWKHDDMIVVSKNSTFFDYSYFFKSYNCSAELNGTDLVF